MTQPCCALKIGDLNAVCSFGPLANAWYGYNGVNSADDSANVSPRSEVTVESSRRRSSMDEELLPFPQTIPCFPKRLQTDPCGASVSTGLGRRFKREPALVSGFLTSFCEMVWPKLSGAVQKLMDERVQEALKVAILKLPESMRGEVHYNISFGDSAPIIKDVYSWRKHPCVQDGIEVCGKMHWDAQVDMQLTIGPLNFGIDRILIDGVGCIIFRPLMAQAPILGGFHLFYCSPPQLRVGLTGLGGITRWAAVDDKVSEIMAEAFKMVMVLPQRMTQRFANTKIEDMPDFRCPPPVGVLQVKVLGARNLPGVDLGFGGRTSDPYCTVTVGGRTLRTSSCSRTLKPDWSQDPPLVFLVYHERQDLKLQIFDENVLRQDIELAQLPRRIRSVADLAAHCGEPRWLDLKMSGDGDGHGEDGEAEGSAVHLRAIFCDLAPDVGLPQRGSGTYVLALKLFHLAKVAPGDALGTKVRLRMGDLEIVSRPCKAIDPGNVHGFGKRMSTQISQLLQKGVDVATVAEAFNLDPEVVEEVHRVQAKEHSWFGWDEAPPKGLEVLDLNVPAPCHAPLEFPETVGPEETAARIQYKQEFRKIQERMKLIHFFKNHIVTVSNVNMPLNRPKHFTLWSIFSSTERLWPLHVAAKAEDLEMVRRLLKMRLGVAKDQGQIWAHYQLLPEDDMVQLEVQLGSSSNSSWSTTSSWLPLFFEAQHLHQVLQRCREAKSGHLQLQFPYGAEQGLVGVSLELFCGDGALLAM
eukprot:s336_g28.t2